MREIALILLAIGIGFFCGIVFLYKKNFLKEKQQKKEINKYCRINSLLDYWMTCIERGNRIDVFIEEMGYREVAIYGMAMLGRHLEKQLKNSQINVKYIIDKRKNDIYSEQDIYSGEEELPVVDAIIVTAIYDFNDIKDDLSKHIDYPIISLEEIVYKM